VLAEDLFIAFVNRQPKIVLSLMRDERTRRYFQLRDISLDVLAEHGFDLSDNLGSVIVRQKGIDNLAAMRDAYDVLAPGNKAVQTALREDDLWKLNQRRHLIVHRRGVVDAAYLARTGEVLPIGSHLCISPQELARYIELVRGAGCSMLSALALPGPAGIS
jgi:hypothetical protein